jgi:hypothetical protein
MSNVNKNKDINEIDSAFPNAKSWMRVEIMNIFTWTKRTVFYYSHKYKGEW